MQTDKRNSECHEPWVHGYLDGDLTASEEAELEAHLNHCARCQEHISDLAADKGLWNDASHYLKRDDLDKIIGQAAARADRSMANQAELSHEIITRQIREWLDPTDDPQYLGRFGGYEIVGVIGYGGMGVVLKGFEPSLNRYVAIKVLSPALATSGSARMRFAREAQAAAAVLHENVIAIHRVDESHGLPFLVMPYVNGVSLQKRIDADGPLALAAILRIGRQIASGLAAAHAQGLVHRDIKPANILLDRGVERVTITDFGLARAADDGSVTKTGVIAGTPQFMSPEQSRGEAIDARSDLFSLGSLLYTMCTGHPPFRAETAYGILRRITDTEPHLVREINSEIPEWFEGIIGRLHIKNPEERFQSAEELAELLEDCLAHVQQPTTVPLPAKCLSQKAAGTPLTQQTRMSIRTGAIGVIAAVALGLFGMFLWQSANPLDTPRHNTEAAWEQMLPEEKHAGKSEANSPTPKPTDPDRVENGNQTETEIATFDITGVVLSQHKMPLADAEVRLFEAYAHSQKLHSRTRTDRDGKYAFKDIPQEKYKEGMAWYAIAVSANSFASRIVYVPQRQSEPFHLELELPVPASLRGRVVDPEGQPVEGAEIWTPTLKAPIPGLYSATTTANGYFQINDLPPWNSADEAFARASAGPPATARPEASVGSYVLRVRHANFGLKLVPYSQVPISLYVRFDRPMRLSGRVIDGESREPVRGAEVWGEGMGAITDTEGRYQVIVQPRENALVQAHMGKAKSQLLHFEIVPGGALELSDLFLNSPKSR